MAPTDLVKACLQCLGQETEELQEALVYLDEGATEAFHFVGGLPFFLQLGVRAVCELENPSSCDAAITWNTVAEPISKIVIITSQLLSDAHRFILRCFRIHSTVQRYVIYTSISEDAHSACPGTPLGTDAFSEYKDLLLQDLLSGGLVSDDSNLKKKQSKEIEGEGNRIGPPDEGVHEEIPQDGQTKVGTSSVPAVTVKHLPLIFCSLTPRVFVLPSGAAFATAPLCNRQDRSFLSLGLPGYDSGTAWDGDELAPSGAILHAHFLHHLGAQLDLKFDIFSVGPLAQMVGKQLTEISSLADGVVRGKKSAALLLLDRSLDLITPSCHGDSLVDRIYATLPRRTSDSPSSLHDSVKREPMSFVRRPSMDVRIPLFNAEEEERNGRNCILKDVPLTERILHSRNTIGGSLSTAWDFQGIDRLDLLFEKRTKDGAVLIRKWIQDALRQENIDLPGKSRLVVNAAELRSLVGSLLGSPTATLKHMGLIQLGKAAAEALLPSRASQWEAFASAERILSISATDGIEGLALQVRDLVKQSRSQDVHKKAGLLSLRDALTILIVAYALAGEYQLNSGDPFSWEEEHALKEAISDAILEGPTGAHLGFLKGLENALEAYLQEMSTTKGSSEQSSNPDDWSEEQWESWDEADNMEQPEFTEVQLKLELNDRIEELFNVLHKVAAARTHYPLRETRVNAGAYRGVINEVLSLILSKADVPGLKHHSSTVGRFLKTGLGRFGLRQAKPKLSDHKVLLVFVIGGFNAVEVREARELQGDLEELLIGGTTLLTPDNIILESLTDWHVYLNNLDQVQIGHPCAAGLKCLRVVKTGYKIPMWSSLNCSKCKTRNQDKKDFQPATLDTHKRQLGAVTSFPRVWSGFYGLQLKMMLSHHLGVPDPHPSRRRVSDSGHHALRRWPSNMQHNCVWPGPSLGARGLNCGSRFRSSLALLAGRNVQHVSGADMVGSTRVAETLPVSMRLTDHHLFVLGAMASVIMAGLSCIFLAAIPTLLAIKKAAESMEKLANTTREEIPGTMAAVRLSGMEISDLTMELSDLGQDITAGVRRSTRAVRVAEDGLRRVSSIASTGTNKHVTSEDGATNSSSQRKKHAGGDSSSTDNSEKLDHPEPPL